MRLTMVHSKSILSVFMCQEQRYLRLRTKMTDLKNSGANHKKEKKNEIERKNNNSKI